MVRRIHTLFTLVVALLLLGVLALWWRSSSLTDKLVLRTAPSYVSGPRLKWVALRTHDGLVFSLYQKIVPAISTPSGPRWRDDITLATTAPGVDTAGSPTPVIVALEPNAFNPKIMSAPQHREYESRVETDYVASAVFHHQTGPAGGHVRSRTGHWIAERLGVWSFGPNLYQVYDDESPGACKVTSFRIPFSLGAAVCVTLLLPWVPRYLKHRRARLRLLRRQCPECGYDLRSSPVLCPECGHEVCEREERRARMSRIRLIGSWLCRTDRRTLLGRGAVTAAAIAVLLTLRVNVGSTAESRRLRRELDRQLAVIADEAKRLRAAGDSVMADKLDAETRAATRIATGESLVPGRTLSRIEPAYARSLKLQRDRMLACVDPLQFIAPWIRIEYVPFAAGTPTPPTETAGAVYLATGLESRIARFDFQGPIRSSILPVPKRAVTGEPHQGPVAWVGLSGDGDAVAFDSSTGKFHRILPDHFGLSRPPSGEKYVGLAMDSRRRRLMVLDRAGNVSVYNLVQPSQRCPGRLGSRHGYYALAYSEHDDCFYALGAEIAKFGTVATITRVSPDGAAEWQIPVPERIANRSMDNYFGEGPTLVAAGRYLAILTAKTPDPAAPKARPSPRCVLIDPHTNTVLYSGPIAPHDTPAQPSSAPTPRR